MDNDAIIRLDHICFAYEDLTALDDITLTIRRGETVILQGPNGCGKSTLLRLLNGLLFPAAGTYTFDGEEITEKRLKDQLVSKAFHQRVGFIFQDSDVQLFCSNVWDEIAFGPVQMGLPGETVRTRVEDLLRMLEIEKLRDRAPYHLSGGEKKRVAIACVLSMNPEVLVLDEPLAGLDQRTQQWLAGFLKQLKAAGKTLIIATHDPELAREVGDRIIDMTQEHRLEAGM